MGFFDWFSENEEDEKGLLPDEVDMTDEEIVALSNLSNWEKLEIAKMNIETVMENKDILAKYVPLNELKKFVRKNLKTIDTISDEILGIEEDGKK